MPLLHERLTSLVDLEYLAPGELPIVGDQGEDPVRVEVIGQGVLLDLPIEVKAEADLPPIAGKTVTTILPKEEGELYLVWAENRQRLEAIIEKMYRLSARVARVSPAAPLRSDIDERSRLLMQRKHIR